MEILLANPRSVCVVEVFAAPMGAAFTARPLAAQFDPHPNFRYFIAGGPSHSLITLAPPVSVNGVTLGQFLTQMLTDDPAWTNIHP
jgi:hypothetical protein